MALFKISKGTASELLTGNNSRYAREGSAWFTTDDGKFYIDVSGDGQTTSAVIGTNRIPLNAAQADKVGSSLLIDDKTYNGAAPVKVGNTIHYIVGNTTGTAGVWAGSSSEIPALYAGLTIAYKIGIAGASTTTLNINGLGAKTVYRNDGKLTIHVPKNSVIILVYDGTYWRWADYYYDAYTVRQYPSTDNVEYPLLTRYNNTAPSGSTTYVTSNAFARYNTGVTLNPSTGIITATKFNGPATHVEHTLTIKFNGGTTSTGSNQDLFMFNGSTGATINITPEAIGALPSSGNATTASKWATVRDFKITDADGTNTGATASVDGSTNVTLKLPSTIKASLTGNATSANKVNGTLTIKFNGGITTSGSNPNMFEYNGSSGKTIDITPAAIGALAASANAVSSSKWQIAREFKISDADATNTGTGVNVDGSGNVTLKLPSTIKASITGNATSADKVNSTLTIKFNGGSNTTGSNPDMFEYNGSSGRTINITPSGIGALGATDIAVAAKKLANYYTSRPANANITHESDGSMITFKATSSMTTNKPVTDGHITHWFWDNSGQYDAQLFISTGSTPTMQFRTQNSGTWTAWQTIATTTGTISVADHVGHSLIIKLNGGAIENNNLFTYNGSSGKTVDITPTAIGALAATANAVSASKWATARDFKISDADGTNTSAAVSIDGSANVTLKLPSTIKATLKGKADEAAKVTNSLTIKFGSSSANTENTNLFTYNGSAGKNVIITPAAIGAIAKAGDIMTGFLTLHADPTNAMHAVTKQYADGLIAAADAMVYKGTLNGGVTKADSTYTPAANAGWTYRVATAGWINDQPVEVGDLIICNTDNTPAASTTNLTNTTDVAHKWNIIQVNIDKAVYYGDSLILDGAVALFSGGSGKVKAALPTGSTTQPIYLNNGIPTAIQYTANRLYYSASKDSFEATNHYASTTKVAINSTSAPGSALHVNGTTTTTDSITVTMANTAGPKVSVSNGTYHTDLFIDTYGTNHGIYDAIANNRGTSGVTNQAAGWIIYRDNSRVYIPAWNSIGSVSKPIYIDGTGHPATVAWELKATVNSGITNKIAYYSGANTISNGTIDTDGAYLSSVSYLNVNTAHQTTYRLYVTGESWIKGKLWTQDLYPDTDTSYDLGSSSYKWRAINLAGSAAAAGENLLTHGINIASAHIGVNTDNNTLAIDSIGNVEIRPSTGTITTNGIIFTNSAVYASRNNIVDLGTNISLWKDIYGHNLILKRIAGQKNGVIKFYSPGYNIWSVYMDTADVAGGAPNGATTSRLGNVTTWSLHSYIENTSGYGWIWESSDKDSETTPIPRMGLSSATGQLRIASNATSANNESGGLIISSAENGSNGNISLELWRGVNASWQIANESGTLYFRNNWTNAKQTTYSQVALVMDYNTGASSIPYLAIGQTNRNTSYKLYVNGTTAHTDDIYLIGDTTRNIYYQGTNTNKSMIRFVNGNADGHAIYIGGGALTVVGSGESASSFSTTSTSETLYLLSDGAINIEAGANSISNRVGLQVTGAGHLLPIKAEAANNLVQDIGSNTYRWRNVYANALHLQGPSSDPSDSAGARIVFSYDASTNVGGSQPVYLSYTPNDSYRAAAGLKAWSSESPFWFEIAGTTYIKTGSLQIFPVGGSYNDGIRIHARSSDNTWAAIMLCGSDNTGDTGTSEKSWFIGNNGTAFWISKNGSTNNGTVAFGHNGTNWVFKGHVVPDATTIYTLGTSSLLWKVLYLAGKADGANDLAYGLNIATSHIGVNTTNNLLGIHSTGDIQLRPGNGSILTTGYIFSTTALYPSTTNAYALGQTANRWSKLYIGTADSYGNTGQPIFWNAGVPLAIDWHIGNSGVGEHNANNIAYNFCGYYTSNGPSTGVTGLGATTTDGAIYAQAYSTSWVGQIAQDYRNGYLYTRSKNNGTWTSWHRQLSSVDGIMRYHYGGTGSTTYVLVTLNKATSWMASFTLRLYQSYTATDIQISGYNYGANHWYLPNAVILGGTTTAAQTVYFGWTDSYKLWVAVPGANYTGADVFGVTNGYTQVDMEDFCTITNVTALPGTTQTTLTIYRPWYRNETVSTATNGRYPYIQASTAKAYVTGTTATGSSYRDLYYNASVYTSGSVLYGAAWNDYAEYRKATIKEPGRVIKEAPTGEMTITTQRLEKGCEIISDTYGFAIGEDDKAKTPTAATGRVLAYTDKPRETFELGMPVCSGPNGTVSQMTEEEARMYPWCIIGTVSEIPSYEIWHGGQDIKVNGRIWIRIR